MQKQGLKSLLKIFVITLFLIVVGQSINAATLKWQGDVEDWDNGVILGVNDLYIAEIDKTYNVSFVDGDDPISIYGLDASTQYGELYEGARAITGYQMSALRSYLKELSTPNIDSRLINGIEDKSNFSIGEIHTLYWYNGVGLEQMMTSAIGIFFNSSDMSIGGGWHNPDKYVTYDQENGDRVYAIFAEAQAAPVPSAAILLGFGLLGLAGIARKKKDC